RETSLQIRINSKSQTSFRDLRILRGLQRFRCGLRCIGEFARIFQLLARRKITAPKLIETKRRDEVRRAINGENSRNPRAIVEEAHEAPRQQHTALYSNQDRGVSAHKLAAWNHFLYQCIHR